MTSLPHVPLRIYSLYFESILCVYSFSLSPSNAISSYRGGVNLTPCPSPSPSPLPLTASHDHRLVASFFTLCYLFFLLVLYKVKTVGLGFPLGGALSYPGLTESFVPACV